MNVLKKITWIQSYYDIILNMIPINVKSVLDVGAGSGIFGYILKKTRDCSVHAIEPFNYDLRHYDSHYKNTWYDFQLNMPSHGTIDCIVALESIEHMNKTDAMSFLSRAKNYSDLIIVATPYKFETQPEYDNNPYQKHQCNITVSDLHLYDYKALLYGVINLPKMQFRFLVPSYLDFLFSKFTTNIIGVFKR